MEIEDTCGTMALLLWAAGAHSGPRAALGAKLSPVCPLRHHQPAPALGVMANPCERASEVSSVSPGVRGVFSN